MNREVTVVVRNRLAIEALELEALAHNVSIDVMAGSILYRVLTEQQAVRGAVDPMAAKVAALVVDHYADNDIAALLGISPSTVARKRHDQGLAKNYRSDPATRIPTSTLGRDTP